MHLENEGRVMEKELDIQADDQILFQVTLSPQPDMYVPYSGPMYRAAIIAAMQRASAHGRYCVRAWLAFEEGYYGLLDPELHDFGVLRKLTPMVAQERRA